MYADCESSDDVVREQQKYIERIKKEDEEKRNRGKYMNIYARVQPVNKNNTVFFSLLQMS